MSNSLAIATVTATLANLVRQSAQSAVPGADVVLYGRPQVPDASAPRSIHLFLYQVTPNAARRNADLPSRTADRLVVQRPQVALDLHYLLAFYGADSELESQRMLGAVVRDLNARPFLEREDIRATVAADEALDGSNLADAIDLVKVTPLSLSTEELSRVWSVFFQTPYTISLAYLASVVLIESEDIPRPAAPVLRRGAADEGVSTLTGPFPALTGVYFGLPPDPLGHRRPVSLPAAQMGGAIILSGANLTGATVLLRFIHTRLGFSLDLPVAPTDRSPGELKVVLPDPAEGTAQTDWAPGVYTVSVVTRSTATGQERSSNPLPVMLAPRIAAILPPSPISRGTGGAVTLRLTCQPRPRAGQPAVLLLAGREAAGRISSTDPDQLVFDLPDAPEVTDEPLRLRVDGAESLPFRRVDEPPPTRFEFDSAQRVTIV